MRKVWTCSTRVGGCLAVAAAFGMLALSGPTQAKGRPDKDPGGKDDGGKKQEIPVSVEFRDEGACDLFNDSGADAICSDNNGPYITTKGKDKGKVFIGLGGQLRFGTGGSGSLLLNFSLADPDRCLPFLSALTHASMVTLGEDDDSDGMLRPDQLNPGSQGDRWDLTLMTEGDSARIGLRIGFEDRDGILWRVQFGDEGDVNGVALTDLVTVVRGTDDAADSWVIEAGPVDLTDMALASLSIVDPDDFGSTNPCNYAIMPFLMTVVKE